jgi:hypothetical protein
MRQGGLKPKGHGSGIYWTRAASQGGRKAKAPKPEAPKPEAPMALDGFAIGLILIASIIAAPIVLVILLYEKIRAWSKA